MDLLKDNLKKLYFKFLIPSLGSAMVMSIYTLTDAIVIGKGVGRCSCCPKYYNTTSLHPDVNRNPVWCRRLCTDECSQGKW